MWEHLLLSDEVEMFGCLFKRNGWCEWNNGGFTVWQVVAAASFNKCLATLVVIPIVGSESIYTKFKMLFKRFLIVSPFSI